MTVKEIEYRSGLPRASVRYYESEGLLHPTRAENGYREYSEEDLNTLLKIKLLRELGCSLEEIMALQRKEVPLGQVLQDRLEALEGETAELERAKALCVRLRDEGATYESLEPGRYMEEGVPIKPWEPSAEPPKRYPWRRLIARSLDYLLCSTAVRLFLAFAMNISTRRNSFSDIFVVTFFSLLLMVAVEPLFLHFFRTTPGKWVCRLRLGRDDGTPFSYGHGVLRTALVLVMGCGLEIPLVSIIAKVLGYWRATHGQMQPWETDEEQFEDTTPAHKEFSAVRVLLLGIFAYALAFCATLGGELWVARLPYPHPETLAEFTQNYNKVLDYVDPDNGRYAAIYPPDGTQMRFSINPFGDYPDFTYEQEAGRLNAVALDMDVVSAYPVDYPGTPLACALNALEGENALALPGSPLYERCVALEAGDIEKLETLSDGGWLVDLDYQASGGTRYTGAFLPDSGETQRVMVTFRARRAEP